MGERLADGFAPRSLDIATTLISRETDCRQVRFVRQRIAPARSVLLRLPACVQEQADLGTHPRNRAFGGCPNPSQ